ncbi:SAM-dependent methyltransferase, partial [Mesorhizobium sp. M7A.T.Ca.TU.009.01.3.2]
VLERAGRRLWPIFSGVIVVEAQKRLYQGVPVVQRASRRVFVPVLSPHGATRLGRHKADAKPSAARVTAS